VVICYPILSISHVAEFVYGYAVGPLFAVLVFLIALPVLWGFVLHQVLVFLERKGVIFNRHRTAFDSFFAKKKPCWVHVELQDGTNIIGLFGEESFASSYPNSGQLYLERVLRYTEDGEIDGDLDRSLGLILRPEDYKYLELVEP